MMKLEYETRKRICKEQFYFIHWNLFPKACITHYSADNNRLSTQRAEACMKILTNKGVESERIQCLGWGSNPSPFRVEDLDANGNLIEKNARKNRAIFILSADATELKNFQV